MLIFIQLNLQHGLFIMTFLLLKFVSKAKLYVGYYNVHQNFSFFHLWIVYFP